MALLGKLDADRIDKKLQSWAKNMVRALDVKVSVHNPHNININAFDKAVVIANHMSLFDIPVIYANLNGRIRMLAKKELFNIPIFGSALKAAKIPKVDRHNREQAIKDMQALAQLMQQGILV